MFMSTAHGSERPDSLRVDIKTYTDVSAIKELVTDGNLDCTEEGIVCDRPRLIPIFPLIDMRIGSASYGQLARRAGLAEIGLRGLRNVPV
jgi:hypothetical protein